MPYLASPTGERIPTGIRGGSIGTEQHRTCGKKPQASTYLNSNSITIPDAPSVPSGLGVLSRYSTVRAALLRRTQLLHTILHAILYYVLISKNKYQSSAAISRNCPRHPRHCVLSYAQLHHCRILQNFAESRRAIQLLLLLLLARSGAEPSGGWLAGWLVGWVLSLS